MDGVTPGDILVRVEGVSKRFCRSLKKSLWYGVCDIAAEFLPRSKRLDPSESGEELPGAAGLTLGSGQEENNLDSEISDILRPGEFWAVNNISFELRRGECLGLIGHNGAGKTTLLKMLNGLIKLDRGRIEMRGRTGALIALGTGFNPILTGRENIYVNGSLLGLSKRQIDAKMDEILDFAEIGEFIDAPVQNYSSGMNVRLGFAVAVVLIEPDVLFLDEVLAVGDIGFTIKCLNTVRRLTEKAAVIFVSHNMQFVSAFCTRVIVMERGRTLLDTSNPAEGIDRYYAMVKLDKQQSGTGEAKVLALTMYNELGTLSAGEEPRVPHGERVSVLLDLEVQGQRVGADVHIYIMDEAMAPVMCFPLQEPSGNMFIVGPGRQRLTVSLGLIELSAGKYSFTVGVMDHQTNIALTRVQGLLPFRVFDEKAYWGKIVRPVLASRHNSA